MTSTRGLELAERALAHAGPDAQVTVVLERSLTSRFARSAPTQATEIDDLTVEVLCLREGHAGVAATNAVDDDALRAAAARAGAAAHVSALTGPGEHPGLPAPVAAREHDGFDPETAALDPARASAALRGAFAAARSRDLEAFGIWSAGAVETAIASSTGVRATDRVTDGFMKVVCRDERGRSGYAATTARTSGELHGGALAERAAARVPRTEPVELPPGEYPAVLEPEALALLVGFLGPLAFNGLAHAEGRGALDGRLGQRVAAACINISDAPRFPRTLPRAIDLEGIPKRPVPLIQDGVAHGVVHDTRSAARAGGGARSTGHAVATGGDAGGPLPTNLVLAGGGAGGVEELAAPIERGIYVTRLWYLNAVRAKQTLLTGTTRDGTFLVEDGRITAPLRDVRFTDSALRMLAATEALTADQRLVSEGDFYGRRFASGVVAPAARVRGFRVTGASL
jgi:PmbA protein